MAMATNKFTVRDAAERFSRDPSRIRQICIEHDIGELIEGRIRLLTTRDIEQIGRIIEETGNPKNSLERD